MDPPPPPPPPPPLSSLPTPSSYNKYNKDTTPDTLKSDFKTFYDSNHTLESCLQFMNEVGAIYNVRQTRVNILTLLYSLDFYSVYFELIYQTLTTHLGLFIYIILPPTKQLGDDLTYTVRWLYYRLGVMILKYILTTKQRLLTEIMNIAIITSVGSSVDHSRVDHSRKTIYYAYIDENGDFNHASEKIRNEDVQVGYSFSMRSGSYSLKDKSGGSRRSKKYVRRWFKKPKSKKSKPNSKSKTKPKTKRRASIN